MRIGIDIDGVLTNVIRYAIMEVNIFLKNMVN